MKGFIGAARHDCASVEGYYGSVVRDVPKSKMGVFPVVNLSRIVHIAA